MSASGDIDFQCMRELLDWHIDSNTSAIVVLGTTGESPTINASERVELIRTAVDHVAGRVPVIVGTGTNSTHSTIELTRQANEHGRRCCLGCNSILQ